MGCMIMKDGRKNEKKGSCKLLLWNWFSLSLSIYLSPKKQVIEIAKVQASKRERESERELSFCSTTCFQILRFLFLVSLLLQVLSLPLATKEMEVLQRKREQERRNTLDRPEVTATIVSLASQLGTQPGSLHCSRPYDNASGRMHKVASYLGSPLRKGNNERRSLLAVWHVVINPERAAEGPNASHMLPQKIKQCLCWRQQGPLSVIVRDNRDRQVPTPVMWSPLGLKWRIPARLWVERAAGRQQAHSSLWWRHQSALRPIFAGLLVSGHSGILQFADGKLRHKNVSWIC